MLKKNLTLTFLLLCTLSVPATGDNSISPEDTVMFILYGVEDGSVQRATDVPARWKRSGDGRYSTMVMDRGNVVTLTLAVRRESNCLYRISQGYQQDAVSSDAATAESSNELSVTVNFSKISTILYEPRSDLFGMLTIAASPGALCYELNIAEQRVDSQPECSKGDVIRFPPKDFYQGIARLHQRQEAALSYLKNTFCPMRAF
jgi:hypothetical protein